MARKPHDILAAIARILNAQRGVFSTAQWGGRAYKLPGPNGNLKRPKLLAFVSTAEDGQGVQVTFKLEKKRAAQVIREHDWIVREPFGSLGRSGWVLARVRGKAQLKALASLVAESRALHPISGDEPAAADSRPPSESSLNRGGASDPVARRIDRVMLEMKSNGWSPQDQPFDDMVAMRRARRGIQRAKSHRVTID